MKAPQMILFERGSHIAIVVVSAGQCSWPKLLLLQQMPTATQNGNVSHMLSRRSILNKFRG